MKYFGSFVVLLSILACVFSLNEEAEIIPTDSDSTPTRNDGEGRVLVVVRPSPFRPFFLDEDPFTGIFNRVFRNSFPFSSFPNGPDTDIFGGTVPEDESVGFDFRDRFPGFDFPSVSGVDFDSLPDNYDNSTHDVKVVNGTKIEVNSTVTKNKDDNGVFIQEVHIVRYSPENPKGEGEVPSEVDTTNTDSSAKNATDVNSKPNPSDNEVTNTGAGTEEFGIRPVLLKRKKRWIIPDFFQKLFDDIFKKTKSESISTTIKPTFGSYLEDTKVNYLNGNDLNIEADAIIFDPEKLKRDRKKSLGEKIQFYSESKISSKENLTPFLKEKKYYGNSLNKNNVYNNMYYNQLTRKQIGLSSNSRLPRNLRLQSNSKLLGYSRQQYL